ncbi:hypothetical protein [Amycolatopsis sp. WGS_07]|uniref:hypothetical protein n=1 Tax=Amycolatopsis sp. WGS_07 TaxID=3076764 RepID=UPI003872C38E
MSTRSPRGTWLAWTDGAELEHVAGTPIVGIARYELHRLLRSLLVRNLALRAMPTSVMARSMLRYTRWQPPHLS